MSTHYQAPQTIAPAGLALGALVAAAGGLLMAPTYAFATVYIPFIYINLLLTGLFGLAVGMGVAGALRTGHLHHGAVSYLIVGMAALFAYWMHWIWWFSALAFRADADAFSAFELLFPPYLFESIAAANEVGTWGMRSTDAVSGVLLSVIWGIEALIFFGVALVSASTLIGSGTYCSKCRSWCTEMPPRRLQADPTGELVRRLNEQQDVSGLIRPAPSSGASFWHDVVVSCCEGCGQTNTVSVKDVHVSHDKKGNEERKEEVVVDRLYISADDLRTLLS